MKGSTIWLFGRAGAGKSTLSARFALANRDYILLDSDNLRLTLNVDLGFKKIDRIENIRRLASIAQHLNNQKRNCIVAAVTPYEDSRAMARKLIEKIKLVYIHANLDTCKRRDPKGLYRSYYEHQIMDVASVYYEEPTNGIRIDTTARTIDESLRELYDHTR